MRAGSTGDCKDVCEFTLTQMSAGKGPEYLRDEAALHSAQPTNSPVARLGRDATTPTPKMKSLTLPRASLSCFSAAACLVLASLTILWASCTRESFNPPAAPQFTQPTRQVTDLPHHVFQARDRHPCHIHGVFVPQLCRAFPQDFPEKAASARARIASPFQEHSWPS